MRKTAIFLSIFAFITSPITAYSAQKNCTCKTAAMSAGSSVGTIVKTSGKVIYTGRSGFIAAKPGSKLVAGSQVSTGAGASADISLGAACAVSVPENSDVAVVPVDSTSGNICLEINSQYGHEVVPVATVSPIIPIAVLGLAAGGVLLISGGNNSASN